MSDSSEEIKEQKQNETTKEAPPRALGIQSLSGNGTNVTKVVNFPFDFILDMLQTHLVLPLTLALLQVPMFPFPQRASPQSGPRVAGQKDAVGR